MSPIFCPGNRAGENFCLDIYGSMIYTRAMKAIILSIGDELILGQTVDTNSAWLSARLVESGIVPEYHQTVPDELVAIVEAFKAASTGADLVIATGGLGPTADDLTRQAMAALAGAKLILHGPSLKKIERFFRKIGRKMPAGNRIQAMIPEGGMVLYNPVGTAPGFCCSVGKAKIMALPGVPKEMKVMFDRHVLPVVKAGNRRRVLTQRLNVFGLGESMVAAKLGKMMARDRNPLVGTTVSGGIVSVRIRGEFEKNKKGIPEMRKTVAEVRRLLGDYIFSEADASFAEVVGELLLARNRTLATAESCTGGMLGSMITEVPGSSRYYLGGWVVYSNQMKTQNISVPGDMIRREGAVSAEVARKMAEGALMKAKADYALAITGIAGPKGGTRKKKVGTVWIALAEKKTAGCAVYAEKFLFPGDRAMIRDRAAKMALNILRLRLMRN